MYEQKLTEMVIQVEDEHSRCVGLEKQVNLLKKASIDRQSSLQVSSGLLHKFSFSYIFSCQCVLLVAQRKKGD